MWGIASSPVDGPVDGAVDGGAGGPGPLGWDRTLDGFGALDGLGLGRTDTGAFAVPAPRRAEPAGRPTSPARKWREAQAHWESSQAAAEPAAESAPPAGGPVTPVEPYAAAGSRRARRDGDSGGGSGSVRRPVKLALYALVLVGLLGGTAAWASMDKSVRLTVDGEVRALHTYAGTVAGVLDDAGVTVGEHDVLAPAADARVADGAEIVLRRGRLLTLTVDGRTRQVWVVATTVDEALHQVGYRQSGLFVNASRSRRLPLDGFALTVRTPKVVTVVADGSRRRLVTTSPTVGEALAAAKVRLASADRVSQLSGAPVADGMTITVTRVRYARVVTKTVVKYKEIERKDPDAPRGSRTITTTGVDGLREVTYLVTYLDGRAASRKVLGSRVLTWTVDQVVVVGTKAPAPGPVGNYGGLNWAGLAQCESGGNPRAVNPAGPYYGLYQFDLGTWQSNGGSGNPIDASADEQTRIAYNLYQARGRSPWPVCGRYL